MLFCVYPFWQSSPQDATGKDQFMKNIFTRFFSKHVFKALRKGIPAFFAVCFLMFWIFPGKPPVLAAAAAHGYFPAMDTAAAHGCFPTLEMEVLAAALPSGTGSQVSPCIQWKAGVPCNGSGRISAHFLIECGKSLNLGDLACLPSGISGVEKPLRGISGVRYSSSNRKVASLSGSGQLKTKKTGSAELKVSYQGQVLSALVQVKPKGSLQASLGNGNSDWRSQEAAETVQTVEQSLKQILKKYKGKVTTSNCYALLNSDITIYSLLDEVLPSCQIDGLGFEKDGDGLIVTGAAAADSAIANLRIFEADNDPFCETAKNPLAANSAKGKAGDSGFSVSLRKAPGKAQLFCILASQWKTSIGSITGKLLSKSSQASFAVNVYDRSENHLACHPATCTLRSGKKTVSVSFDLPGTRLEVGHQYTIAVQGESFEDTQKKRSWTKGITFVPATSKRGR